jgi:hypothetical protein
MCVLEEYTTNIEDRSLHCWNPDSLHVDTAAFKFFSVRIVFSWGGKSSVDFTSFQSCFQEKKYESKLLGNV